MVNKRLTEKDVCLIIPTYNRADDVYRTLSKLMENKNIPGKVIIIDQSKNDLTRKVVSNFNKKTVVLSYRAFMNVIYY